MAFDSTRDPLPIARDAIDCKGTLPCADVVFLAHALIEAHKKVDQLYAALEERSDSTRLLVERVLRDTANNAPSTAACRDLRIKLREALDRGPVFEGHPDQKRLDWLSADPARVLASRLRMLVEGISLRESVDGLVQSEEATTCA